MSEPVEYQDRVDYTLVSCLTICPLPSKKYSIMHSNVLPRIGLIAGILLVLGALPLSQDSTAQVPSLDHWKVHDKDRPQPPMVDPGPQPDPIPPPSDALILFDGDDLTRWETTKGKPARWTVENGYMQVAKRAGAIQTKQGFGDIQLHIEWAAPNSGDGQDSGNSGVFLMKTYEVQVLNSHGNVTYPDGQAASIYGQYPPLVNASRPPGQWQTYDIIFRRPRFDADGALVRPARLTVLHNGVLVQDNVVLTGPTSHKKRPPYKAHADKLPLMLQDHNEPTRYRNIWVRELPEDG